MLYEVLLYGVLLYGVPATQWATEWATEWAIKRSCWLSATQLAIVGEFSVLTTGT